MDQHLIVHYVLCLRVKPEKGHHAASKFKTIVPKLGKTRPNRKAKDHVFERMYYSTAELRRQPIKRIQALPDLGDSTTLRQISLRLQKGTGKKQESITVRNPVFLSLAQWQLSSTTYSLL